MNTLSWETLKQIHPTTVALPQESSRQLPEKILQFGTGVLLRGLPDYYVDQANRKGIFQGRIVAVKSTTKGPLRAFHTQEGLYTLTTQGQDGDKKTTDHIIVSAISRVLSAAEDWAEVLRSAADPQIQIILSNTTEAGIVLQLEDIHQQPPASFPAKLLACLYQRYRKLGNTKASTLAIVPTELIPDNGAVLQSIILKLARHNKLDADFYSWLRKHVHFCNSLVDRIVPGRPNAADASAFQNELGYHDTLQITAEPYNLWAIEGSEAVADLLSFEQANAGMRIVPDINLYRETKLRLLNATHTLCSGMAVLAGIDTVYEAATHPVLSHLIRQLMLDEIAMAIPYPVPKKVAYDFAHQTFARFSNPFIQHRWINITSAYSVKLKMRVVPVLLEYYKLYHQVPGRIALGFSAFLRFMKITAIKDGQYFGTINGRTYPIHDGRAADFNTLWTECAHSPDKLVEQALSNSDFWGTDLTLLPGFCMAVQHNLKNSDASIWTD